MNWFVEWLRLGSIAAAGFGLVVSAGCATGGPEQAPINITSTREDAGSASLDGSSVIVTDGEAHEPNLIADACADDTCAAQSACITLDDCGRGENCSSAKTCVATSFAHCAAIKASDPAAGDGVYWILDNGSPLRAYCDMAIGAELCTEIEGDHQGMTRDGSHLAFKMRSVMDYSAGVCNMWGLRAELDDRPFDILLDAPMTTCEALGYRKVRGYADRFSYCMYGTSDTSCGFAGEYYRYGNRCSGCSLNNGLFPNYVKQGPMMRASLLSDMAGSIRSGCAVRHIPDGEVLPPPPPPPR